MIATATAKAQLQTLLAVATLFLLASCSVILPKREPTRIYELAMPSLRADWPQATGWSLLVARPEAGQLLDTDSIGVRPAPGAVQTYKNASWTDAVPDLVQTGLVRTLEDSKKILAVSRPGGGVRGEYQLLTELRAFESEYAQPGRPQAVIEVYARLIHTADGQVVAARRFRETEPANSEALGAVVEALSRSFDRLSGQLVDWTLSEGNRHQARSAPGAGTH